MFKSLIQKLEIKMEETIIDLLFFYRYKSFVLLGGQRRLCWGRNYLGEYVDPRPI
jgi:hypothetical protein